MKALLESGFEVPEVLQNPTNIGQDKYYDQIAFKTRPVLIDYLGSADRKRAGTIDIFERLFTPDQLPEYEEAATVPKKAAETKAREAAKKAGKEPPKPQRSRTTTWTGGPGSFQTTGRCGFSCRPTIVPPTSRRRSLRANSHS